MKMLLIILLCCGVAGTQVFARNRGEHFEPVYGGFFERDYEHDYFTAVRSIFYEKQLNARASMLTLPSFEPESAVFITLGDDVAAIVSSSASESIWFSQSREAITVNRQEKSIRPSLALEITSVFEAALAETKYPPPSSFVILDGVRFFFTAYGKTRRLSGQTHSPDPDTMCGELVALGVLLHKFARENIDEERLATACRALANRISNTANHPVQRNAGSRPSSGDSPASATPPSPAPRG